MMKEIKVLREQPLHPTSCSEPRTEIVGPIPPQPTRRFIRGPIPLSWLERACRQSGKSLNVALCLIYLYGITKNCVVRPSRRDQSYFFLSRQAYYAGLRALEGAGLVKVDRCRGRKITVTLIGFEF